MEKLLISLCFLGINSKYNGGNNKIECLDELRKKYELIPVCPEVFGNLTIPRLPSEIKNEKVLSKDGKDVTANYVLGAEKSLDIAIKNNITKALLKDGSPSCGVSYIYDGTFSNKKINGLGITTKLLEENNIKVYSENEIDLLLK